MFSASWWSIVSLQAIPPIDTELMFPRERDAVEPSAIDSFIANTDALNRLYVGYSDPNGAPMPPELGPLILLGYMSAVEGYFRSMIRRTILIDPHAAKKAEAMTVPYGAALRHRAELLPEALLEGVSFAGEGGVKDGLRTYLGVSGPPPAEVAVALRTYAAVCEIRHCCVHRFGRLGSQNAIRLGLETHGELLERSFEPTVDNLQDVADVLRTFVKAINNWVFSHTLKRSVKDISTIPSPWTWNWDQDRDRYGRYYSLFASITDSMPSPSSELMYKAFRAEFGPAS